MIATFISTLLLVNPSINIIRERRLETPEGRALFLTEKLTPYVTQADQLNREIIALSGQVTEKVALMKEMLPTLQTALHVSEDFEEIDALLESEDLTDAQQEIADRIASLCSIVDPVE